LAVLLEDDSSVEKWMKPGPGQFRIEDADGHPYQPDFVVETKTENPILEPKMKSEINDDTVQRKARAAIIRCHVSNECHSKPYGEKPWRYALIPHGVVQPNATLQGLLSAHVKAADLDLMRRFELAS